MFKAKEVDDAAKRSNVSLKRAYTVLK